MKPLRKLAVTLALAAVALGAALPAQAQSAANIPLAARTSDAGGVRVVVKPKNVAMGSPWEFDVTMDTHSKPLSEDLAKISVLVDDRNTRYAPLAWQGDPPGGHHRKGALRFPAPAGQPKSFTVEIDGLGSTGKRVFRWGAD